LRRLTDALKGRFPVESIDTDIAGGAHPPTKNRDFEKLCFCQPPELNRKTAKQHGDVKIALMVAHVNIGPGWIYVRKAINGYLDTTGKKDRFRP
jgi:hypothetical protein